MSRRDRRWRPLGHAAPRDARRLRPGRRGVGLLTALALAFAAQSTPVDVGQFEHVEVRYALVDVLVLDRRDRTVPGLVARDFDLLVGGEPVAVVSVDEACSEGAADDPRAGRGPVVPEVGAAPLSVVHVFDYPHIERPTEALSQARDAIARRGREDDEQAVAVFAPGLRIESPPTRGTAEAVRALDRMEQDRTLYDGAYARLTERGFFRSLGTLLDVLEVWPGAKVVLLYSGPFLADGFDHDADHRDVAARAARARVVLYTIDAAGIRPARGFRYGDLGGPKSLARLAVETGGRFTWNTNDLGLGYARAQRDMACRYTIGFYSAAADPDRPRALTIRVKRRGVRVVYPQAYAPRSEDTRREGRRSGALAAPELFPRGGLSIEVDPPEPRAGESIRFRLRLPAGWSERVGAGGRVLGRVVRRTGVVVHEIDTELEADSGGILELAELDALAARPYRITVVVSRAESETPYAVWSDFDVRRAEPDRESQGSADDHP